MPTNTDDMFIGAVTKILKSRLLAMVSLEKGTELFWEAVEEFREVIRLDPLNIEYRLTKTRHFIEITKKSPFNLIKDVETDLHFLETSVAPEGEDLVTFWELYGEYYLYKKDSEKVKEYFNLVITSQNATKTQKKYAKAILQSI